ncbi:citryl-CoA lyase [Thermomicrobiaceae bacterium CFH 74404]|uniref:citrate synthase (unknown stereospecificity) n=1 Tax=Thermalbibacter longus TaxID=2951981 RepID=A0AA41WDB3_9BACT|nr:citryl-CoA lyase [Thermalbibacter longus]MCM8748404.1 citryl-CoA lyase [Thermalbibacter longus]
MEPWRTAITDAGAEHIRIRGYDITELMQHASFADTLYLIHRSRLPSPGERRLIDAILIASSDHGPGAPSALAARVAASGNRRAPEAAIAAGILAIGDYHGGAGEQCMVLLAEGIQWAEREGRTLIEAAERIVDRALERRERLPGLGHRTHQEDPRATLLFALATEHSVAGKGVELIQAIQREASRRIRPLPINVDGALAAVLFDLGFEPIAARFFFIVGRVAGLTAQVYEELHRERPMRIHVPVEYDGPEARALRSEDAR